jgi:hypothetical protein
MQSLKLLLLFALSLAGSSTDPQPPVLFETWFSDDHPERFEKRIAVCKKMSPEDRAHIHQWLESGAWKKGATAMPVLPSPGSFVFRRAGTNKCWIIGLLADVEYLTIDEGRLDKNGNPIIDMKSFRCLKNEKVARILEREIERHHPAGKKKIDEHRKLAEDHKKDR